ncbi:MAG: hypothetical protein WCE63_08395 [Acidobacteriaceae bacterium]
MIDNLHYDKDTEVAYVDVCPNPPEGVRIDVVDVTQELGLKTQVLARVDENGELLGLVIQDYPAFKRELRRKYLAFAVEKIIELIVSKVRDVVYSTDCTGQSRLPARVHA